MHIQQLHLDGISSSRGLSVQNLSPGFNVLYGAPSTGKSSTIDFVRSLCFGSGVNATSPKAAGHAVVECSLGRYRLSRQAGALSVFATPADTASPSRSLEQIVPGISPTTYDRLFHAAFRRSCDINGVVAEAESVLSRGSSTSAIHSELQQRLAALESKRSEWIRMERGDAALEALARQREELASEIRRRKAAWGEHSDTSGRRRAELEQLALVREGALANANRQIDSLDEEIASAEGEHQELLRQYEELQRSTDEKLSGELQLKLKKITEQMLRWNRILGDLIERRDRIRSELVEWATGGNDQELAGPAGRIATMEQLIGDLRRRIRSFAKREKGNADCGCRQLHNHCGKTLSDVREQLYELCEELSKQQYRYRRNAMNNELKQLRRCHGEVTQYLQRLVKRRNQLLRRLGEADPTALARVVREQRELSEVEENENLFDLVSIKSFEFAGDWESVQRRLGDLDYQLEELRTSRVEAHREADQHRAKLSEIRAELNTLTQSREHDPRIDELRRELQQLDERHASMLADWRALNDEISETARQMELQHVERVNVLAEASHFLRELTANDFLAVRRSAQTDRLVVESRTGKSYAWEALTQQTQDLTQLSVCLAAAAMLHRQGIACPVMLDDLFAHIDEDRITVVAGALKRFAEGGVQVVASTGWETAATRCESIGVRVQRLTTPSVAASPPPTITPTPVVLEDFDTSMSAAEPARQPTFGDGIPDDTYYLERTDPIEETPDLEHEAAAALRSQGVDTIGDFLEVTADDLRRWSNVRISTVELRRCQTLSALLCDVINLRPYDVRILVGAGIQDAHQLRRMTSEQLLSRVESFVRTDEGRAILVSGDDFELARVANWIRSARESREFHRETERQQALRNAQERSRGGDLGRLSVYRRRTEKDRDRTLLKNSGRRRETVQEPAKPEHARSHQDESSTNASELRFHLNRESDVEAAPSIGPKMAEHLEKVGVITVGDLLNADPQRVADDLNHRRANEATVKLWQQQAEWVCRVPELRGHDAQILVACGYHTVEDLDGVDAENLFQAVQTVVETKEGRRILRGGNKPDRTEIENWIRWSKHSRQLRAA